MTNDEVKSFKNALSYIKKGKAINVSEGEIPYAPAGTYFKMPIDQYNMIYKLLFRTTMLEVFRIGGKTIEGNDNIGPFSFSCILDTESGEKNAFIWAGPNLTFYAQFQMILSAIDKYVWTDKISLSDFSKDGGCKE